MAKDDAFSELPGGFYSISKSSLLYDFKPVPFLNFKTKNKTMNKRQFNDLTTEEQWNWVVHNSDKITHAELEKGCTLIHSEVFRDGDCTSVEMKGFLGVTRGTHFLLAAIGITSYE